MPELSYRIRQEREKRALLAQDLAHRIHLSPGHLSRIEHGKSCPTCDTMARIAVEVACPDLLVNRLSECPVYRVWRECHIGMTRKAA